MTGSKDEEESNDGPSPLRVAGTVGALGFELLGFVLAGLFLGSQIDARLGSEPRALVSFVFLALVAFGWHAYRVSRRFLMTHGEE